MLKNNFDAKINEMFNIKKMVLMAMLHLFQSKISVSWDVWTSKNQISFLGITIHYIEDNWELKNGLVAFKFLETKKNHTGLELSNAIIELF